MLSFLCIVQLLIVVVALVAFFFTRSSKKLPKNFAELKSEFLWQVIGIYGLVGDFLYRSRNHVGKFIFVYLLKLLLCLFFVSRIIVL